MENKVSVEKKIKRKKFFASLGVGLLGVAVLNQFPFNLVKNTNEMKIFSNKGEKKIKVQINPLAVNRNKIGGKNA